MNLLLQSFLLLLVCSTSIRLNTGIPGAVCIQDIGLPAEVNRSQLETEIFSTYDGELHPWNREKPVKVFVKIVVMTLYQFDEKNMVFTVKVDLHQQWQDARLKHSRVNGTVKLEGDKTDKLWRPSTFIINSKDNIINEQMKYALIDYNGTVHFAQVQTLDVTCNMDFRFYPVDKQICPVQLGSYVNTDKEVLYQWMEDDPVIIPSDMSSGLDLEKATAEKAAQVRRPTGTFSILEAKLHFHRRIGYSIIQIYLPTILLSIVSWLVLWFPRRSIGERSMVVLTAALTLMVIVGFNNSSTPDTNYLKSIDVFVVTSLCQMYLLLFACVIIYYVHLNEEKTQKETKKDDAKETEEEGKDEEQEISVVTPRHPLQNADDYDLYLRAMKLQFANPGERGVYNPQLGNTHEMTPPRKRDKNQKKHQKRKPKIRDYQIDNIENGKDWKPSQIVQCCARVIFPIFYLAFNIYYWLTISLET